jgi:hypothetical protein
MKAKIAITLIVFTLVLSALIYGVLNYPYSTGTRSGKLVKLTEKGFVLKTFEGTLSLGTGDNLKWDFTVRNRKLGRELIELTGRDISLNYRELIHALIYDTKYDILSYELVQQIAPENNSQDFCQLVHYLRRNKNTVDELRAILERESPVLLEKIKNCQKFLD